LDPRTIWTRDKEWLDKNNEEARGEGARTLERGPLFAVPRRRVKIQCLLPVVISEDEFELVIGIFEKVTHERTEFLHHVRRFSFLAELSNKSIGSGKQHGLSSILRSTRMCFSHLDVRHLFSPVNDTKSPAIKDSKCDLPVLEGMSNSGGHRIIPILNVGFHSD
jgi:hypothetical protein